MSARMSLFLLPLMVLFMALEGRAADQDYFICNGQMKDGENTLTVILWGYRVSNRELVNVKARFFVNRQTAIEVLSPKVPAKENFIPTTPRFLRRNLFPFQNEEGTLVFHLFLPRSMPTENGSFPGDLNFPVGLLKDAKNTGGTPPIFADKKDSDIERFSLNCQMRIAGQNLAADEDAP